KAHQRELLLDRGVETVHWTFDPLEARNAHLNLRRLGAVVREYRRNVYGPSSSPLHAGIGTDRLVAEWPIASDRVARRLDRDGGPGDDAPSDAPGPP
ncbi:MAG: GCN5 family acetyltransferase, partial [Gemmatimonadetes bacterium]|nr:GCN5 family acetyltransferase [Gemmatimonadota bacterium]NIQ55045.1 GCN5 family acetyltransferase [Gemmatimonadota bacterium]NIU75236.1 GCN5 family acetyltransferase [Gammaproteobacteria bacterium]NIX45049.1 GCN5 family acetyltransferase [Gemmatimonadota bacterium]NIY09280.1 GCN5 family acetyltransferase [Gemmatimonadota bacterium]